MKEAQEKLCSFWDRQQARHFHDEDFSAFGYTPSISEEQAEAEERTEQAEDIADPPCGVCVACRANDDEHEPSSCSKCGRGPLHATESDDEGRCLSCARLERFDHSDCDCATCGAES